MAHAPAEGGDLAASLLEDWVITPQEPLKMEMARHRPGLGREDAELSFERIARGHMRDASNGPHCHEPFYTPGDTVRTAPPGG